MTSPRPRPRSRRRKWLFLTLAVVGTLYLSRGYFHRSRKPVYPPNAFYEVKRGDMLISITEDGALRALNETVVRSGLEGLNRVIRLAPEGTHVKKGELLVELDSSLLKDRLNEQELLHQERLYQLLQATGNLQIQKSLAESEIKDAELKVENAESDLEKYRDGDAPLLIKTVEARSSVLTEQVRIATDRFARTQELFKTGNATRSELEADALSLKREQLAFGQYQEDLRLIKKFDQPNQIRLLQSKVIQAKEELARLKQRSSNEIAQAEADLKTSERSVEFLEESLKTQKRRLDNAKILAPQDGLVVYAAVSPFQSMGGGNEGRRDEGRFRGGRGGGGAGGGGDNREFRGGGRRGGRSNSEGVSGSLSSSTSGSSPSTAQSVSAANQRIASAISGASPTQGTQGSSSEGGSAGGSGSSGGSRGGGGSGSGGGSGGGDVQSASRSFVSYSSMRPSSTIASSGANGAASGSSGSGSIASSSSSSTGQSSPQGANQQFGFRSSSQNFGNFPGFESFGTAGFLEEGTMVRQRQELIRLPDVSKMLAEVKIHESRVSQLRVGMTAYVRVENIPDRRFKGTVRRVAILPDAQMTWLNPDLKVFPTDVLIEDELPDLKPGVSARAEIIITNLTKVLSVPIQTVARLHGENVCFVKRGLGVASVPVTTGWFNDRFIEVSSGLKEGDHVLLAPVGDEAIEAAPPAETNAVETTAEGSARPAPPPVDAPPAQEQRIRPRNSDSPEGEAPPERRRNRQGGGRRSQNSGEAPE